MNRAKTRQTRSETRLAHTLALGTALAAMVWVAACGDGNDDAGNAVVLAAQAERVDAILAPYSGAAMPAVSVLVARGDDVLYERVLGSANVESGEPATPEHVYAVMSVSKSFTAVAVLKLVEDGALSLDDPVSAYLPELERFGPELTLRHLLQHTSGFPNYDGPFIQALLARSPTPDNFDALAILSEEGAVLAAPGEAFAYSDLNFEMLALIVERVSGESFTDFQERVIFAPAGMHDSFTSPNPERESRAVAKLIDSYFELPDGSLHRFDLFGDLFSLFYGAAGVVSNARDMLRFHRALHGGELVDPALLDEAFTAARLNDGSTPAFAPFEPEAAPGLGFIVGEHAGHRRISHGGAYLGYRAYYLAFPDDDLTVILMIANSFDGFFYELVLPIADVYLGTA